MRYIESFILPDTQIEERAIHDELRTVFNDFYPFGLFPNKNVSKIEFEPITILYGDNGSGKSTLLNAIVKEKVAIMTNKPQTTRTAIKAIVNRKNSQIIFIDTPGIHKPKSKLRRNITRYSL